MTNVRSINQDNVLGGDDLSPSEFDDQHLDDVPAKKSSGMLPMIGGLSVAVLIVGFFGWKILSPYLGHRAQDDIAAIAPIENTAPAVQPQSTAVVSSATPVEPQQPAAIEPQPIGAAMAAQPAAASTAPQPAPIQPAASPIAPQTSQPSPATVSSPFQEKAPPHDAAVATGQEPHVAPEDLIKVNKRIDEISAALASLKDAVEKLKSAKPQSTPQVVKPVVKTNPTKPVVTAGTQKKPVQTVAASNSAAPGGDKTGKPASSEQPPSEKPAEDYQLQAVLKGIAWFKTKSGETLTVGPGDELKGVGVVDQIDPDASRVTFTNGRVFH